MTLTRRDFGKAAAGTVGMVLLTGCPTGVNIATQIIDWTPALQSGTDSVLGLAGILLPADLIIFQTITAGFNALCTEVVAQAKAYLANPNQTFLQAMQTAVITFQQSISNALLQAVKITNPASQQKVSLDLNTIATIVNTILGLINNIKGSTVPAAALKTAKIKLYQVRPLMNRDQSVAILAEHYQVGNGAAGQMLDGGMAQLEGAGF